MHIADRCAANGHPAGAGRNHGIGRDFFLLQRQRHRDRLHGGAGLENIGQGAVAQLLARQVLAVIGVIARIIGQSQHFAGLHIQHHYAASFGALRYHSIPQFLPCEILHLAVDGQMQILAVQRRNTIAHALDHAPQTIADHAARTRLARQLFIEGALNAFQSLVFDIGKTHDMRHRGPFRVLTAVFLALVDASNAQFGNFLGNVFIHLTLDVDKVFLVVGQLGFYRFQRHVQ